MKTSGVRGWLSLVAILPFFAQSATAKDHFLTIGGGYSPTGNQVSLEKNVYFLRTLLAETYGEEPAHNVFFSDGLDPGRDLQFNDPDFELPRANELVARIHRNTKYLTYQYRDHGVTDIDGGSNPENLANWFDKIGAGLSSGDRLFIYATAHGGKATDSKDPKNTRLYLWNNKSITVREFAEHLDKVDPEVPIVMVMVQCYSGGFGELIFDGGDTDNGLAAPNRCGFFATVHDRVAAGCTADIREEDYHEYSTYFWAALRGKSRTDSPIESPDFDEDGKISFAEAHAYALIESPTIDISIKTSDVFLRHFSSTDEDDLLESIGNDDEDESSAEGEATDSKEVLTGDTDFERLLALADREDAQVLSALSEQLRFSSAQRYSEAKSHGSQLMSEKRDLARDRRQDQGRLTRATDALKKHLVRRWPEFSNPWSPHVGRLLEEEADDIVAHIESHDQFAEFQQARVRVSELSRKEQALDRQWVKCQRLMRCLENVALAANLPLMADEETVERYRQLVALEHGQIGDAWPPEGDALSTVDAAKD